MHSTLTNSSLSGALSIALLTAVGTAGFVRAQQQTGPASRPASQASALPSQSVVRVRSFRAMGTDVRIEASGATEASVDTAIEAAVAEIARVEDRMTDWRDSPLMDLNAGAGKGPTTVPLELAAIIARSIEVSRLAGGAFDPTFAAIGVFWDFKDRTPELPDPGEVCEALESVGATRIRVDPERSTVDLPAGMRVGLGGIAKGYAVDRAMSVLREHGVRNGTVNAGGDLKVLGLDKGQPWEIAIKHPRRRDYAIAVLRVANTCVVTSGDYERFFEIDGERYHHILDPRTGYPSKGCISATVTGPNAELADALATAMCVLGPEAGLKLLEKLPKYGAILIGADETIHASPKLAPSIRSESSEDR